MVKFSSRHLALELAEGLLYKPYIWGGDDFSGFDCSGLWVEILKSVGKLPNDGDWRAADLFDMFKTASIQDRKDLKSGCLVFYGDPIFHVEGVYGVLEDGKILTIGAMGGGSKTLTEKEAKEQNAYIRIRPIKGNWTHAVDPFYPEVE